MADDQAQEAPEGAEGEPEPTPEAEGEAEGEAAEGEAAEGDAAAGAEDEDQEGEPGGETAEGEAVADIYAEPPITADDVFSLFMPSQNALDRRAARIEYLKQLKVADQEACQKAMEIQAMKLLIEDMEKKKPMTEAESCLFDQKQEELFNMLLEFEDITKKVHELADLAELDSKSSFQISPYDEMVGPPLPTSAILNFNQTSTGVQAPVKMEDTLEFVPPKEKLPKLVICGTGDWPPKIVICETPKNLKATTERGTNTESQIILKLKNEIQKTKSGAQIPVKKLYTKLKDLDKDIMDVESENAQLTRKLFELLQGGSESSTEGQLSLSEANKEQVADDMNVVASGDSSKSQGEGSVAQEASELNEKPPQVPQMELPLPHVSNCTCGRRSNAFSLEFELTKIETEVQRMLTEIDCAENKTEKKPSKPAVVIGACNIAALYNPS